MNQTLFGFQWIGWRKPLEDTWRTLSMSGGLTGGSPSDGKKAAGLFAFWYSFTTWHDFYKLQALYFILKLYLALILWLCFNVHGLNWRSSSNIPPADIRFSFNSLEQMVLEWQDTWWVSVMKKNDSRLLKAVIHRTRNEQTPRFRKDFFHWICSLNLIHSFFCVVCI